MQQVYSSSCQLPGLYLVWYVGKYAAKANARVKNNSVKKILGKIVDSFTMENRGRVIILDRDCSADLNSGDLVTVTFTSGSSTTVKVLDATLEDGVKFSIDSDKIATIRVENSGFPEESIQGCEVSKA